MIVREFKMGGKSDNVTSLSLRTDRPTMRREGKTKGTKRILLTNYGTTKSKMVHFPSTYLKKIFPLKLTTANTTYAPTKNEEHTLRMDTGNCVEPDAYDRKGRRK